MKALAVYAGIAALLLAPALFTSKILLPADMLAHFVPWSGHITETPVHNAFLSDVMEQVYPYDHFLRAELSEGRIPLWNPYVLNGTPFLAVAVSAVFCPLKWLLLVLPIHISYEWGAFTKLLLAGLGIFLYSRRIGVALPAATASGAMYMFSGYVIYFLLFNNTNITVLFGFGLLALEDYLQTRRKSSLVGFSLVLGLGYLGGHPESAVLHHFAYLLYAVVRDWRRWLAIASASILGITVSALSTLPFVEFMLKSATFGQRSEWEGNPFYIAPSDWPVVLTPYYSGSPVGWSGELPLQVVTTAAYLGVIPFFFVLLSRCETSLRTWWLPLLIVNLWAGTVLFGIYPVFHLFTAVPVLKQGNHLHIIQIFQSTGALLAGLGLSAASRSYVDQKKLTIVAVVVTLVYLIGTIRKVFLPVHLEQGGFYFLFDEFKWPIYSILGIIFLGMIVLFFHRQHLAWVVLALVLLNGFLFGVSFNTVVDPGETIEFSPPSLELIKGRGDERVVGLGVGTLLPNYHMALELRDLRGYESLVDARVPDFYAHLTDQEFDLHQFIRNLDSGKLSLLRRAGCSWVISPEPLGLEGLVEESDSFPFVYSIEGGTRAEIAKTVNFVGTAEDALDLILSEPDHTHIAIEGSMEPVTQSPGGTVVWIEDLPGLIELEVEVEAESHLILRDTYFPGWQARIDGTPVEILRADVIFRAVKIPPGRHLVRFEYLPASFRLGLALTVLALTTCLALCTQEWIDEHKAKA